MSHYVYADPVGQTTFSRQPGSGLGCGRLVSRENVLSGTRVRRRPVSRENLSASPAGLAEEPVRVAGRSRGENVLDVYVARVRALSM